jgi:hypothetical protein
LMRNHNALANPTSADPAPRRLTKLEPTTSKPLITNKKRN